MSWDGRGHQNQKTRQNIDKANEKKAAANHALPISRLTRVIPPAGAGAPGPPRGPGATRGGVSRWMGESWAGTRAGSR